jgi:cation diffusion facilitator CzcD-associated flavoprotein CzcO
MCRFDLRYDRSQFHKEASAPGMKAIVIGAGIGGFSAAIALRKAGVETVVFEPES